jgi:hypothetical protein
MISTASTPSRGCNLDRIGRDLAALIEAFGVFVQLWFAHTRLVADDRKARKKMP